MEMVMQPTVIPPPNYIASQVTLCSVTLGFICIRLGANYSHAKKLAVDDYLSVVALLTVASYSATSSMMNWAFNSDPTTISIIYITRLAAACIFTATSAMYFAKLPLLLLFLRTFGIKRWLRYTCHSLMIFTALGFLASAMYTGIKCSPEIYEPGVPFLFQCVGATFYTTVSRNVLSLVVDVVIFILPLPIILKLKLPLHKKIGIALVFLTGSFALAAGAVSLYFQASQASSTSTNITNAMLATVVECCIIIIVSCATALRVFWTNHLRKTPLFKSFAFARSATTSQSKRTQSKRSQTDTPLGVRSNEPGPIRVMTNYYIELRDNSDTDKPSYNAAASHKRNQEYV